MKKKKTVRRRGRRVRLYDPDYPTLGARRKKKRRKST